MGFLPAATGLYAAYFVWPAFNARPLFRGLVREPVWSSVEEALALALLGAVAVVIGSSPATDRLVARLPRIRREIDFTRALPLFLVLSSIGFLVRVVRGGVSLPPQISNIVMTIEQASLLALGGLLIAWLRDQLQVWHKVYLVCVTLGFAAIGIAMGMMAQVVFPLAGYVFLYCWERKRIPWGPILAGALVVAPFQATKNQFRALNWSTTSEIGAWSPKLFMNFMSMMLTDIENGHLTPDDVADSSESRIDTLSTMAIVVDDTPQRIPYWDGYTYSDLAWHLVPRFLLPDKPALVMGQEFPRRYGLIDYSDVETAYNLSQTVELYINFGALGVGLGLFVIGVLYRTLDHLFSASSGGALIGSVIFAGLMNIESNFSQVWGGIPLQILAFYLFIRLLPEVRSETTSGSVAAAVA
jgi:hypothetical protein